MERVRRLYQLWTWLGAFRGVGETQHLPTASEELRVSASSLSRAIEQPTTRAYDCRPYSGDSNETCSSTVPAGQSEAYITIHGYTEATYRIDARWVAP